MPWSTISTDDVLEEFSPAENNSIRTIQNSTSNLQGILTKAIKKARSQINAGGNQLDQTGLTIPDGQVMEVIAIVKWKWLLSLPALKMLQTKERQDDYQAALQLFERISSQEPTRPRTELPPVVDSTPVPIIQPSMGERHIEFKKRNQDG